MKRVFSAILAIVMVFGLTSVALAATVTRQTVCLGTSNAVILSGSEISNYDAYPGCDPFRVYLFSDDGYHPATNLKRWEVEYYRLGIQIRATAGGATINRDTVIQFDRDGNAYYDFEWVDPYVAVDAIPYRGAVYITIDKSRVMESEFALSGIVENLAQTVRHMDDYVYTGEYPIVYATDAVPSIQVDMGEDISIWMKMDQGMKYYSWVTDPQPEDALIRAEYPDIDTVYSLKTINMNALENRIAFYLTSPKYIYVLNEEDQLVFLGNTNKKHPYYTKYFLSSKLLTFDTGNTPTPETPTPETPSTSGSSSSSGNKSSGGGGGGGGGTSASVTTTPAQTASPLSAAAGKTAVQNAVKAAAPGSKKASASIKNASSVSLSVLKEMAAEAQKSETELTVNFDQVTGSKVMLRLSINPALAKNDIDVTMSTDSAQAKKVQSIMAKWFSNATFVISCGQKESFGQSVTIAAALPEKFNTANLKFYSYDSAKNKYTEITGIKYWIDNAGYLHITTETAGDIVVSDGPLTKK